MLRFHVTGDFTPEQVRVRWTDRDTRPRVPEVEALIDAAWDEAIRRPNVKLFDGPMCRLDAFDAGPPLTLSLGPTSYRPFMGTNLSHPDLAERYGRSVLANPLGVSPALETSDGYLLLGRRNDRVAYYPGRIHPFAGCLEPGRGLDVFAEVARELREELGFTEADVSEIRCTGIAEDVALRQPELIFRVSSPRTRRQIEATVDADEHAASYAVEGRAGAIEEALRDDAMTPVARASLLLWGRVRFGTAWFGRASAPHLAPD